ncbi:MAG TPA: MotA/TolQ/ExbB proton channel family protein [Polyangia bacterium]|jgi:biopolymer transport protein ExbB/TolQ|nr:MotA/TolQ/ExbB proton channel family protein [Polyangia bacterium]
MDFSLIGLWSQMGGVAKGVVVILLFMSMYAIGIALERLVTLRRAWRRSMEYIAALQPLVSSGTRLAEARQLEGRWKDAPVARILGPAIADFMLGLEQLRAAAGGAAVGGAGASGAVDAVNLELLVTGVSRSMDRGKKREVAGMQRGLPVLATISSSAPFVGLFGTVFGIITAFQQMADPAKGGGGGLASVSAGIAEALLTTAVGLAVAIVSVWFYNFFVARLDKFGVLVDDTAGELADRLLQGARGGQGPGRS